MYKIPDRELRTRIQEIQERIEDVDTRNTKYLREIEDKDTRNKRDKRGCGYKKYKIPEREWRTTQTTD